MSGNAAVGKLSILLFVENGRSDMALAEQLRPRGLLQIDFLPLLSGTNVFLKETVSIVLTEFIR